jgi:hypothetical protein
MTLLTGWSEATYISSTELRCDVPSSTDSKSLSLGETFAEVQLSFDGFPVDSDTASATWDAGMGVIKNEHSTDVESTTRVCASV